MIFDDSMGAALVEQWHDAPHRWGHPWHAMCSYMAMFPPTIPKVFIEWLTKPGDVVYDPFSGRGTTLLEACLCGRIGLGSDASPLAWVLSSAKAAPPQQSAVRERLGELRQEIRILDGKAESPIIREIFDPRVLGQLLWLRENLSERRAVDRYLMAILLGVLHLNAKRDGTPRGLSIAMPNTFAMAPRYVARYKATHGLQPPSVDVLDRIEERARSLGPLPSSRRRGFAWLQDTSKPIRYPARFARPKLIFASPPYLGVMKYAKLNWLRMWMLREDPKQVDGNLFSSSSLTRYKAFMATSLVELERVMAKGGRICLLIGDVRRGKDQVNLAAEVAEGCIAESGLNVDAIVDDPLPIQQKVSRIWGERKGRATEIDRILILSRKGSDALMRPPAMKWS